MDMIHRRITSPQRQQGNDSPLLTLRAGRTVDNRSYLLALHALDQNASRRGTHDARVRQLALAQRLAEDAAGDVDLLVTLRLVLLHQADAAQFLVIRGEADLHRLDEK